MLILVCCMYGDLTRTLHTIIIRTMISEPILVAFGKRIQQLRKSKGISQEKLAEYAGVHRTYIGMIERAEKNITLVNIQKLAKALDVSISKLFENE